MTIQLVPAESGHNFAGDPFYADGQAVILQLNRIEQLPAGEPWQQVIQGNSCRSRHYHATITPLARRTPIGMMQAPKNGERADVPTRVSVPTRALPRLGNMLVDAVLRPRSIEICHVLCEDICADTAPVRLTQDQDVVEACTADLAQQTFADHVRPWRRDRCWEHRTRGADCTSRNVRTLRRVVVAAARVRRVTAWRRRAELLSDPCSRR